MTDKPGNMFAAIKAYPANYPPDDIAQDLGMTVEEVVRVQGLLRTTDYEPTPTRIDTDKAPKEWNFELAQGHEHMTRGFNNQDHFETLVWLGLALSHIQELERAPQSVSFTGWTPDLQRLTRDLVDALNYENEEGEVRLYSAQGPFDNLMQALGHISGTHPVDGHVEAEDRGGSFKFGQMAEDDAEKEYARKVGVHMSHCYQGEQEDHCKYGDDDCPAKDDTRDPGPEPFPITDQLIWKCGVCCALLPSSLDSVEKHYLWHRSQ